MSHPRAATPVRSGMLALVLLVLGLPLLAGPPATAAPATVDTPLTVHLIRMTPAVIPTRGKLVLAGTVTNSSGEPWSVVNVYPFISTTPMTTREQLAAAAKSDPSDEVGKRLLGAGDFATVGDLLPGQTTAFRIAIPVKDLPIDHAAGVYWIGVHALGQNSDGRDGLADGRARTFIPLVNAPNPTSVAVVVPVRDRVRRDALGRLVGLTTWSANLAPSGRLGRIAGFLASAGPQPTTLLMDPAVLEAVSDLAADNPALSLGNGKAEPSRTSSPSPSGGASRAGDRFAPADRANAAAWLSSVIASAKLHTVLGLGYADPDVAALARRRPALLRQADRLAAQTFTQLQIPAVPTVAPPSGWFDDDLLPQVPAESMVLVSDHAAPRNRSQWRTPEHQDLVFTDQQAATGGPGPTDALDALALRQRILSDAALRASEGATGPMVVKLPDGWDPGAGWQLADFFNALNQPWLNLVSVNPSTDASTPTFDAALGYPAAQRRLEVPRSSLVTAGALLQTTTVLSALLRSKNTVNHDLAGIAFDAVSYHARRDNERADGQVSATNAAMRSVLAKVQVIGTDFVTLSGGSGSLSVTLVNGLDQPITVGIKARTSTDDVKIAASRPLNMEPGQRTVLRLKASASKVGVTQVVLSPVTSDGADIGTPLSFRLRTSQVGKVVWAVIVLGLALLTAAIIRRITLRVRAKRRAA
ncbi:MAG: DUF6049 family protein [Marmoricola sp.]